MRLRQTVLPACSLVAVLVSLCAGWVAPAQAALLCKQWRVGPYFRAVQDNGYTVLFQLRQYANGKLAGNASYVSKGKAVRGPVLGGIGDTTFKARVEWGNNTIGNYIGSPWFVKPSGSAWRTNAATGEAQPIHCDPADAIRQ